MRFIDYMMGNYGRADYRDMKNVGIKGVITRRDRARRAKAIRAQNQARKKVV